MPIDGLLEIGGFLASVRGSMEFNAARNCSQRSPARPGQVTGPEGHTTKAQRFNVGNPPPQSDKSRRDLCPSKLAYPTWKRWAICGHPSGMRKIKSSRHWNLVWKVSCSALLALWKRRKLRSPSPRPSPRGEGELSAAWRQIEASERKRACPLQIGAIRDRSRNWATPL